MLMTGFEPQTSGSEATTLPTELQPLPNKNESFNFVHFKGAHLLFCRKY